MKVLVDGPAACLDPGLYYNAQCDARLIIGTLHARAEVSGALALGHSPKAEGGTYAINPW